MPTRRPLLGVLLRGILVIGITTGQEIEDLKDIVDLGNGAVSQYSPSRSVLDAESCNGTSHEVEKASDADLETVGLAPAACPSGFEVDNDSVENVKVTGCKMASGSTVYAAQALCKCKTGCSCEIDG